MSDSSTTQGSWQAVFDRQLGLRILTGAAIAVIALAAVILGDWWAAGVAGIIMAVIHQEWTWLTEETRQPAVYYTAGLLIALVYVAAGLPQTGLVLVAIAVGTAAVSSGSI